MQNFYVSGLQRFSRVRVKVPSPSTTLRQLMEQFCRDQKLPHPECYVFSAFANHITPTTTAQLDNERDCYCVLTEQRGQRSRTTCRCRFG